MIRLETQGELEDVPGRFIGSLYELLRRDVLDFGEEVEGELVEERRRRCPPLGALPFFGSDSSHMEVRPLSPSLSLIFSPTTGYQPQSCPPLKL